MPSQLDTCHLLCASLDGTFAALVIRGLYKKATWNHGAIADTHVTSVST
ncbi:hypothetical protein HMPREF0293_1878 [Corynebacterium glucuronolyticum ATCC 51866]|uniref:Uncharacterized protein n=1 Tax=Corynebacterium glucuronolyticum ATCC 51866 TaxID=548478 RepID=A0ABM9XNJ2_9CORY|nr:hypothetical protein HMPREF0293_1878 [Corynebacterium glucuronolyticum ATCC 51866]